MSEPAPTIASESRLAALCRGVAEAVWLAALIGVPLLFEPRAVNCGYQPYKLGLFRALALIGLAAWLVHAMETSGGPRILAGLRRHRLVQALAALALAVVVSTACSVEWQSSLWGAYETAQGAVTWAAGLALLGMIAWFLRTREQADRAVTTLLVTSFAIALMSLLQRVGYDPQVLFFGGSRAFGSMGNPIYLGGYLLMVVPLTLARLVAVRSRWQQFYGLVLLSQLAALYFTLSRGPLLGLLSGVFAFAALYVTRRGMARCQLLLGGLAVSVCVLALAGLAFASTQRMQGAGDPSVAIPLVGGDSGRSTFWSYAPKILAGSEPLQLPDGGQDRLAGLRLWFGHGLDTLDRVIPQHRVSGDSAMVENRFHNLVLDHGYTMGLMGLGAFLTVLMLAFHGGFQALGLIPTRSVAKGFWICTLGASAVVCALAVLALGPGFVGLGCALGLAAGLLLHVVGVCPIVKRIWTPAWTLFSGGLCFLLLAGFGWVIDAKGYRRWAFPLVVIGMNSIAAYLIAHLWEEFVISSFRIHLGAGFFEFAGAGMAPFWRGAAVLAVFYWVLLWMYRRKLFLKV